MPLPRAPQLQAVAFSRGTPGVVHRAGKRAFRNSFEAGSRLRQERLKGRLAIQLAALGTNLQQGVHGGQVAANEAGDGSVGGRASVGIGIGELRLQRRQRPARQQPLQ